MRRVLITTVGPGSGTATNTLFLFDPSAGTNSLTPINLTVPPPTTPTTSTLGRQTLFVQQRADSHRWTASIWSASMASVPPSALIFVYETASATVLRSREVRESFECALHRAG